MKYVCLVFAKKREKTARLFCWNFGQPPLHIVIISRCRDLFERAIAHSRSFIIGREVVYSFLVTGASVFWRRCVLGSPFKTAFAKSLDVVVLFLVQITGSCFSSI